jgi:hypothetical protein
MLRNPNKKLVGVVGVSETATVTEDHHCYDSYCNASTSPMAFATERIYISYGLRKKSAFTSSMAFAKMLAQEHKAKG